MWKLASNSLGVKNNLIQRGLSNITPEYTICGNEEMSEHINFNYSWTLTI